MSNVPVEALREMSPTTGLALALKELARRTDGGGLQALYPDHGPMRRELYVRHLAMFEAGARHNVRAALGGNRVGKSFGIGGYETALHLTGLYPEWWKGKRYDKPILAWACGVKTLKVRDVNQRILLGNLKVVQGITSADGGLIPARMLGRMVRKGGVVDAIDRVTIQHKMGHENILAFKSYEEGVMAFESESVPWIWLDEEPPKDVYDACLMRVFDCSGSIIATLTPVEGMTETVMALLEGTEFL